MITADRFWTTKSTVKENIDRFLNNLKKLIEKFKEDESHE